MTDDDRKRFAALITGISSYYRTPISSVAIDIYWDGLKQFDYEAIERAFRQHTQLPDKEGHFMPQISDVKKMIGGGTSDQASLAWSKVNSAVRLIGPLSDIVFDDPLIHRVLADMGGWAMLGTKEEKEWPFIAKEFENRYRGYRMSGQKPEYPRVLTGSDNAHNVAAGRPKMPARLSGNEALCLQVARGSEPGLLGQA